MPAWEAWVVDAVRKAICVGLSMRVLAVFTWGGEAEGSRGIGWGVLATGMMVAETI